VGLRPLPTQSRRVIVSFEMGSGALGNKRRSPTPDVPNAPDPHSNYNTSAPDACLRLFEEDTQEDYCGEEEDEVCNALEVGGREGEGVTRGQESRMREISQENLRPQEMNPFKAGSPAPSHIGGCRNAFPFAVAESPKIGEVGGEVSEPKRTSRGRVKRVATLPASFASGPIPPTCTSIYAGMSSLTAAEGDKRGLDVISRDVMSSEPAAGDKRSALDAPDTDDDDGCAQQGEGAGAAGPKPEQVPTRNKKLRRDGEAHNLSQQQRDERKAVMTIIRHIEQMEYKEQTSRLVLGQLGLRAGLGIDVGKWVRNVAFVTHTILGGTRRQKRTGSVREDGREARSSTTRGRKRPNTRRKGFKARGKGKLWRRESVLCPREPARQGRRSVGREWAGRGQEEAL
jgi:hypothetical protein